MDKSKVIVMLDNGHGCDCCGKRSLLLPKELQVKFGTDKLYEYKYTREIVKGIEEALKKDCIQCYIVTPENYDVSLKTRVQRANNMYTNAKRYGITAFFVSVHINAAGDGTAWKTATGWSGYTSKGQTKGDKLADKLYEAAHEVLDPKGKKIRECRTDGDPDIEENFYVLKNTNCAATLTESFFMDNLEDCKYLLSEQGKADIIKIHVEGIKKYIKSL